MAKIRCTWADGCNTILNSYNKTGLCGAHELLADLRDKELRKQGLLPSVAVKSAQPLEFNSSFKKSKGFEEMIISVVAEAYGIHESGIFARKRILNLVNARQVASYLIRKLLDKTMLEVAAILKRDHSTIVYSCQKVEELLETDSALQAKVTEIQIKLEEKRRELEAETEISAVLSPSSQRDNPFCYRTDSR